MDSSTREGRFDLVRNFFAATMLRDRIFTEATDTDETCTFRPSFGTCVFDIPDLVEYGAWKDGLAVAKGNILI